MGWRSRGRQGRPPRQSTHAHEISQHIIGSRPPPCQHTSICAASQPRLPLSSQRPRFPRRNLSLAGPCSLRGTLQPLRGNPKGPEPSLQAAQAGDLLAHRELQQPQSPGSAPATVSHRPDNASHSTSHGSSDPRTAPRCANKPASRRLPRRPRRCAQRRRREGLLLLS